MSHILQNINEKLEYTIYRDDRTTLYMENIPFGKFSSSRFRDTEKCLFLCGNLWREKRMGKKRG